MTLSEYSQLKKCIVVAVGQAERHKEILSSIKDLFKADINSVRRFEQIHTIGQLLHVLEIRDILSEDNVKCLKSVALLLNSDELLNKITEYEDCHVPREPGNYYVSSQNVKSPQEKSFSRASNLGGTNIISEVKKQRIIENVTEDIGSFWRDLGRNLNIKERDIDNINIQHKTLEEKAAQILIKFDYLRPNPNEWFFELCEALEKTRRKDIVRSMHKIMTMNI